MSNFTSVYSDIGDRSYSLVTLTGVGSVDFYIFPGGNTTGNDLDDMLAAMRGGLEGGTYAHAVTETVLSKEDYTPTEL